MTQVSFALETNQTVAVQMIAEYSDTEFPAPDSSVDGFSVPRASVREIESLGFLASFEYSREFGSELNQNRFDI